MSAISLLNPKAEFARAAEALSLNISAAKGIQDVMRTNLGPKGTMKMLVSGAGDIKITKDGNVLLHEMQIQHPTAALIARASTAMDDSIGDGTTSTVLVIAELLKQAQMYISEGVHPRILTEGFNEARGKALEILDQMKITSEPTRELLTEVTKTALRTKLHPSIADLLTEACVGAVLAVKSEDKQLDLHMVEILTMQSKTDNESQLVKGLVLDHGARHPNMPKKVTNAKILICNVSLEYEKTEVNSGFFYKTAEEREKLVKSEREFIVKRVEKILELKKTFCRENENLVVINQKGIDPVSLDMLAREGIVGIRRAKRRNMERLALACGGRAVNCLDDFKEEYLGYAGLVYEYILGENKFTFVEECKDPRSVTILLKGQNSHTINQMKDAVRDGLRAIKNTLDDKAVVAGAGAFEVTAHRKLLDFMTTFPTKVRLGIKAFADALLVIPKTLAVNSGLDPQDVIVKLLSTDADIIAGLDIATGEAIKPADVGVYDNVSVKRQMITSCTVIASNLLLVDEVMRAGLSSLKG